MKKLQKLFLAALMAGAAAFVFAAEHVVEIQDNKFKPEVVRIKAGDTVRWVNQEKRTTHSVLFKEPTSFESERFFPGESWTHRFDNPGRVLYGCGPHPEMKGVVEVE